MKKLHALLLTALAATTLSACGGGGGGNAVPSIMQNSHGSAAATFVLTIPAATQSSARSPKYVSPNTQSVTIASTTALSLPAGSPCSGSGSSVTCNTTGTSSGCTSAGATLTCSFNLIAQVGSDQFTLTMFSGTNASGSTLSSGSVSSTVSASGPNNIAVTMNGVVDSVAIALANASPATGASATIPVTVTAKDPSGATIVGPGTYTAAITLTDSDTSGATTLSTTSVSGPGAAVTLSYNGSPSLTSATIGATVPGIPATKITAATLTPATATHLIAGGSGALAIFTNSAHQTFAFVPTFSGLAEVEIADGSTVLSHSRRTQSSLPPATINMTPAASLCTADPTNAKIYCANFTSNVINVVDASVTPAAVVATYTTDAPSPGVGYSAGSCVICGIVYDPTDGGILIGTGNGYELYSAFPANAHVKTIAVPVSENFGYNAVTDKIFSPHYQTGPTGIDIVDVAGAAGYTLTPLPAVVSEPDQGAVDTSTNVGVAVNEFDQTATLVPLAQATLNSPAAGQFSDAGVTTPVLTSSLTPGCGTNISDVAVDSQSHFAFFTGEFCADIGMAVMPATAASTMAYSDWVFVNLPSQPDGQPWNGSGDPHALATFNLPSICPDCGAVFNSSGSYTAVVDLNKLKAAPRDTTDPNLVAGTYDMICSGLVTFIASDQTMNGNSGCSSSTQTIAAGGGTFSATAAGFTASGTYPANSSSGVTLTTGISTEPPPQANYGGSPPGGTPMVYFTLVPSANVTWTGNSGFQFAGLVVPAWVPTGKTYTASYYDSTFGALCGSSTGTLSGNTITFGPGSGGSSPAGSSCVGGGNQTIQANHVLLGVVTYQ
jgi:hypothetical protein